MLNKKFLGRWFNMPKTKESEKNPFVAIGASLGGIILVMVILTMILAKESFALLIPIVWAIVVLGIVMGAYAYKKK